MNSTQLFHGGGEMAQRMRNLDWANTPLGPTAQWPQSLKAAVQLMLGSRYPMFVWWGAELTKFYNDAYIDILGPRHPWALSRSAGEVWQEIWNVLGPQAEMVLREGTSTWNDRVLLVMQRKGWTEETYFTFSYSPAFDDDGSVGGVFCACTEDTSRVLGERRLQSLRLLSSATVDVHNPVAACLSACRALQGNPYDLPFVLIYSPDAQGIARLTASAGLPEGTAAAPMAFVPVANDAPWPLDSVSRLRQPQQVTGLGQRFGALYAGPWPEPINTALVLPLTAQSGPGLAGWLVVGLSPRRQLDDDYRDWLSLVATQISAAMADAGAFEAERRRAEQLAELDRAKTAFFTNVSHEFRTPLTLMLGPLEDALEQLEPSQVRAAVAIAQRNAERLLKLVNSLLDFSSIEAGRVDARFVATDLAACTADLASNFRAACERAGLALTVDCQTLPEPVYVDREQWERIVLNLLSNAFKFTLEGAILVEVRASDDRRYAELRVCDSGCGIAVADVPRLFKRFQQIEGTLGRSVEGSGIGLSLAAELIKLHGGSVTVSSETGVGSKFTVRLPFGTAHLPAECVQAVSTDPAHGAQLAPAFLAEALQWLPDAQNSTTYENEGDAPPANAPRILVADDNADLRAYLGRLLSKRHAVHLVGDGEAAWEALQMGGFDLLVTDVMMPRLDGFALIARLRNDLALRTLPVIMLSARAGEESRIEGLDRGADDYLVKPFAARELLARVAAHLASARVRREAAAEIQVSALRLREALVAGRMFNFDWNLATGQVESSPNHVELLGLTVDQAAIGFGLVHPDDLGPTHAALDDAILRRSCFAFEQRMLRPDNGEMIWVDVRGHIVCDEGGVPARAVGIATDVSERKRVEDFEREQSGLLSMVVAGRPLAECLHALTEAASRLAPDARAAVLLADARSSAIADTFSFHIAESFGAAIRGAPISDMPIGTCGTAIHTGEPVACTDIASSTRWSEGWRTACAAHGILACVSQPVFGAGKRPIASFFMALSEARNPSPWERRVAEFGAYAAGIVVERDRDQAALSASQAQLRETVDDLTRLHETISGLTTGRDPADAVGEVMRAALTLTGARHALFTLTDAQGDGLDLLAHAGFDAEFVDQVRHVPPNGGVCGACQARRERVVVEDVVTDPICAPYRAALTNAGVRSAHSTPLLAADGRVLGVLSLFMPLARQPDLRELRLMDLLTRPTAGWLEQHQQAQALRDTDRRKDEFLATLSHELRNPLAPIRNGLRILRLTRETDVAEQGPVLDMMERQVTHVVRLVDDLMEVSRITSGKIELKLQTVDLSGVLSAAVEAMAPRLRLSNHTLDLDLPAETLLIKGDPVRLAQVLANLLDNAIKYSNGGTRIALQACQRGDSVVVSVRDAGIGIPAEMLPRIFEPFTQIDRAVGRSQGGLGIGLALVKNLVLMHNGTVAARSAGLGQGSEFELCLPLDHMFHRNGDAAPQAATQAPNALLSGQRILVVDDNRDAADSMLTLLVFLGADVRTAYDGLEALEIVRMLRPAIVLLDLGMPGMDGYAVARQIRAEPQLQPVGLVAVSGWGQPEDKRRSREAGFDHHFVKPVTQQELTGALIGLLNDRHGHAL